MKYVLPFLLLLATFATSVLHAQDRSHDFENLFYDTQLPAGSREIRAVWLTTIMGLDWPQRPARTESESAQQRKALTDILDKYVEAGINTVLFQTRVRSTTMFPSDMEPWDGILTGEPGRAPSYDPLQFAIDECHKRGLEIHAWIVAFPICKADVCKKLGSRALPRQRPELCQLCGDKWVMDPGVPETGEYLARFCAEVTRKYDIDGLHFDYIRYPEKSWGFRDDKTYAKYGNGQPRAQWRRDNVTRCVRLIHDTVKAIKPWVRLSCSPVGKYADLPRQSSSGWNARDAVSQDAKLWLREGLMDMVFPMMYFDGRHFYPFVVDWNENSGGRPIVPGLGAYLLSGKERGWSLNVIRRQMNVSRQVGCGGQCMFRSESFTDNTKGLYDFLARQFYRHPALPPAVEGATALPTPPTNCTAQLEKHSLRFHWTAVAPARSAEYARAARYHLYACPSDTFRIAEARRIATNIEGTEFIYTPALPANLHQKFFITTFDAFNNESEAARVEIIY